MIAAQIVSQFNSKFFVSFIVSETYGADTNQVSLMMSWKSHIGMPKCQLKILFHEATNTSDSELFSSKVKRENVVLHEIQYLAVF